jgi:hypothetical protein
MPVVFKAAVHKQSKSCITYRNYMYSTASGSAADVKYIFFSLFEFGFNYKFKFLFGSKLFLVQKLAWIQESTTNFF